MKLHSDSLHFEIMKGSTKPSGYIRNSYRENGKVKHQTISRINGLSLEQLQNMKAAFNGKTIKFEDIVLSDGREYGASALLYDLAKKISLDKLIYSRNEPWVRNVLAMIIGRVVYQGSKLSLSRIPEISCLEQSFRSMKTVDLEIRPIYHRTDDRIKAHVFLCMLSYYLLWHLNKLLIPFYANRPNYTRDHVLEVMKSLQKCKLTIADITTETIAEPTENQRIIQNLVAGQ